MTTTTSEACHFCGRELAPDNVGLEWQGRVVPACAWCDHIEAALAVREELAEGVPCARLGPLQAATRTTADSLRGFLADLVARAVLVVDGDEETTWGWRLAEVTDAPV